ncbi:metallophosphoesterase [Lactobacillus sp. CBA3606]|uniref:metallophosphoesterase family protein n=1 Tax=Lactobacillus sp. CBA3606 TaxID=2099789 RepID=UPI00131A0A51|nr:metallophosphoesterase [Lactobacillus sp. CBA3606]
MQQSAIQYLLNPEKVHQHIRQEKSNLLNYFAFALNKINSQVYGKNSVAVNQSYQQIFNDPLFEIQINGRLLQHEETGAISANIPAKFLIKINRSSGISEYLKAYMQFVIQLIHILPIATNGRAVIAMLPAMENQTRVINPDGYLSTHSNFHTAEKLLAMNENNSNLDIKLSNKPILKSEVGKTLIQNRKNYTKQSISPNLLAPYFENTTTAENDNLLNVVSDIHSTNSKLPIINQHFNILAGDISDSQVTDKHIRGVYVLGNHDTTDALTQTTLLARQIGTRGASFLREPWFKKFVDASTRRWWMLPIGDNDFYKSVSSELQLRFPKMTILNNNSTIHDGVRYIGITIPIEFNKRINEEQHFLLQKLNELLDYNYTIPTIIISHAPLFNELSLLTSKNVDYHENYVCLEPKIKELFTNYNILGVIHGHHHIPASSGTFKMVKFANKDLFVICSIYAQSNTGFDLTSLINYKRPTLDTTIKR